MSKTVIQDEILFYSILCRLPTKPLVRFKCVCKSWDSSLCHPSFIHFRNRHSLLFLSSDPLVSVISSKPHVFSAPYYDVQPNVAPPRATLLFTLPELQFTEVAVQYVNCILCFHPKTSRMYYFHDSVYTVIANPTTRQVVTLPLDPSLRLDVEFILVTHFGYDPIRDEFKVLRLVKYRYGPPAFKVFTVGRDCSWRVINPYIPNSLKSYVLCPEGRGICVNGAIHWRSGITTIVAFEVGTEQFRIMRAPEGYQYRGGAHQNLRFPDLAEIGGCLCLIGYCNDNALKMWILVDYEAQEWEPLNIQLPYGLASPEKVYFPLCKVPRGEILLLPYFISRRVRGFYYDMENETFRCVIVMEMSQPLWPNDMTGEVDLFFCEESFRSL